MKNNIPEIQKRYDFLKKKRQPVHIVACAAKVVIAATETLHLSDVLKYSKKVDKEEIKNAALNTIAQCLVLIDKIESK